MDKVILRPRQIIAMGYYGSRTSLWRSAKAGEIVLFQLGRNSVGAFKADLDARAERLKAEALARQQAGAEAA
jgi:hypothetical protein